jgi:hypothetical protein
MNCGRFWNEQQSFKSSAKLDKAPIKELKKIYIKKCTRIKLKKLKQALGLSLQWQLTGPAGDVPYTVMSMPG